MSHSGDAFEREADTVADQVMRMTEPVSFGSASVTIQEKGTGNKAEEKRNIPTECEPAAPSGVEREAALAVRVAEQSGAPLPTETRSYFEPRFGHDFSEVQLHTDTQAAEAARAMSARGYTYGNDIVFGAGEYSSATTNSKGLLAHELTHVIQQRSMIGSSPLLQRQKVGQAISLGHDPNVGAPQQLDKARNILATYATYLPYTSSYINLDESGLARLLAIYASFDGKLVLEVFDLLHNSDTDDVAYDMVSRTSDTVLGTFDQNVLRRLRDAMMGDVATATETQQVHRLEGLLKKRREIAEKPASLFSTTDTKLGNLPVSSGTIGSPFGERADKFPSNLKGNRGVDTRYSTGPPLNYKVRDNSKQVNPLQTDAKTIPPSGGTGPIKEGVAPEDQQQFASYPTVQESSGWLLGTKGIQITTASNGLELGLASLMNYDVVYLTGGLLEEIQVDPDLLAKEDAIVFQAKQDPRYQKQPFDTTGVIGVEFGGKRWSSTAENWGSSGSANPLLHSETLAVGANQLTWALRHAAVKYLLHVDIKGGITISYHLNDKLDLSSSPGRSDAYNDISDALGFYYHDLAGGNINLQTRAEWVTKR